MLGPRALNRALLARQLLLERRPMPRSSGASSTSSGCRHRRRWRRTSGSGRGSTASTPTELAGAIVDRRAVRDVADALDDPPRHGRRRAARCARSITAGPRARLRGQLRSRRDLAGLDLAEVLAAGRDLARRRAADARRPRADPRSTLAGRSTGGAGLRHHAHRAARPGAAARRLGHERPRRHGRRSRRWLGRPLDEPVRRRRWIVLATSPPSGRRRSADIQAWSGVTRLRPALEALRPDLRHLPRRARGASCSTCPTRRGRIRTSRAPPRFLPEYDNVLIGHADRSRIIPAGRRIPLPPGNGASMGTFLVDGMFAGTWRIAPRRATATLDDRPVRAVSRRPIGARSRTRASRCSRSRPPAPSPRSSSEPARPS